MKNYSQLKIRAFFAYALVFHTHKRDKALSTRATSSQLWVIGLGATGVSTSLFIYNSTLHLPSPPANDLSSQRRILSNDTCALHPSQIPLKLLFLLFRGGKTFANDEVDTRRGVMFDTEFTTSFDVDTGFFAAFGYP